MASLVLALVLLALAQDRVSCHHPFGGRSGGVTRAQVNDVRLGDLHDRIGGIAEKMDSFKGTGEARAKELVELEARLDEMEDSGCDRREFRCNTLVKQCIGDVLVCDKSEDCPDGSDEAHCNNPAVAGTSFEGKIYNVKCFSNLTPDKIKVDVIASKRLHWFTAVVDTTVHITATYADGREVDENYEALYYFGQKTLVVYPREGEGVALQCHFRTDESDFCHAEFKGLSTGETCGEAILVKQE